MSTLVEKAPNGKPLWCMGCTLYDAPGPVFGPPAKPNDTLFLGEAPGGDEVIREKLRLEGKIDASVTPNFQGGSGRVLYSWCKQVGIYRDAKEVRNVVKCRPTEINKQGKTIDRPPTEGEMRHCAVFLKGELETIKPNIIVALGASALYVTTARTQIGTYRGRLLEGPTVGKSDSDPGRVVKVLPVYHPAYIMRAQELWPVAVFDLARAKEESKSSILFRHPTVYTTDGNLSPDKGLSLEAARASGYVVFDLEAEGIHGKKGKGLDLGTGTITVMGLTTAPYSAHALHWTPETQRLFYQLTSDPDIEKVGQNSEGFDIPYCELRGATFKGKSFDTLQAFHLTNSELEKNLEFISSFYAPEIEPWKGKGMYQAGFEALKQGNCLDIDTTCRSYLGLKKELKDLGMEDLYYNGVMPLQPVLRAMHDRGLKRDEEKAFRKSIGCELYAKKLESTLREALGSDINLDSPKQLAELLYKQMGLPTQYKRDKKRGFVPTCDDNALDKLAEITNNSIFKVIHERRKVLKLKSTFIDIESDENGYIHYHLGSAKAATEKGKDEFGREKGSGARNGRLVSWNPNFQNIPLELRELYIPDSAEHVFVEADWSQIEWRGAMVLAGEPFGLEVLASGADNHSITAAECFNLTLDEVAEKDREFSGGWGSPRFETKFIVYGLGYGRGAADIAKQLGRPIQWVEGFIQRFRTRLPVYWAWRNNLEGFVGKNSYLANPFGRRRWWYTRQVTEMYNFPPSSTAADMMYRILPILERQLPKDASLRLTVHDSVLVNAAKDVAKETAECVRDIMHTKWERIVEASDRPEVVKKYYPDGWFCPADVHIGQNWRECKKGNKQLEKELLS